MVEEACEPCKSSGQDNSNEDEAVETEGEEQKEISGEEEDFLTSFQGYDHCDDDEDDNNDAAANRRRQSNDKVRSSSEKYNSRKPKWWRNLSGRATNAQRRSKTALQDTYQWPCSSVPRQGTTATDNNIDWKNIYPSLFNHDSSNNNSDNSSDIEIWLEIGFGQGDNLLRLAQEYPNVAFLGAEVHPRGVGKLYQRLEQAQESGRFWQDYVLYTTDSDPSYCLHDNLCETVPCSLEPCADEETLKSPEELQPATPTAPSAGEDITSTCYPNLRIHVGDGIKLLRSLPDNSLTTILITFPDPFPKNHERKWRVVQQATLIEMHRVLKPHGRLYLATDHPKYAAWCQELMTLSQTEQGDGNHPGWLSVDVSDRTKWLPVISPYEQKGWQEGRHTHLLGWQKGSQVRA